MYREPSFREPLRDFAKWERVVEAEKRDPSFPPGGLPPLEGERLQQWKALSAGAGSESSAVLALKINRFFNQWPYKEDAELWGRKDYWATPREFMSRSGDCEDYAAAKFYALRSLGIPAENLQIALVGRSGRPDYHAVLLVRTEAGRLMLDSASDVVSVFVAGDPYVPLFFLNEDFLWRHAPQGGS